MAPKTTPTPLEKRAVFAEYERRQRLRDSAVSLTEPLEAELRQAASLRDTMFPQQKAFFEDSSRRKVAFCTRRAGKTIGVVVDALSSLLENPSVLLLYIAQTLDVCRIYVWRELRRAVAERNLPFEFNENSMTMKHTRGGGALILKSAEHEKALDKLRGPKWFKVYLDESSTFGTFMENLILEVIGPALRDHNGTLMLIGTAGRKREGLFYEACHGLRKRKDGTPIYKKHEWSLVDNPYLSDDAKDLDLIMEEEGFTPKDPRFLREYMKLWVTSDTERVWAGFAQHRNEVDFSAWGGPTYQALTTLHPGHKWEFLLGMDFGWQDESGIAVIAYSRTIKTIYCLETWAKNHAFSDEIAQKVMEFRGSYGARRYVGDVGGQGKIFQQQLLRDYQIFVEPARKQEKYTYIEFMNSALMRGDLLCAKGDGVGTELMNVAWNAERTAVANHEKDNRAHALMYGWRAAAMVAGKTELPNSAPGAMRGPIVDKEKVRILNAKPENKDAKPWWDTNTMDRGTNSKTSRGVPSLWCQLLER